MHNGSQLVDSANDLRVLEISLKEVTKQLNDLVADCADEKGNPKEPSRKVLMQSKASLPSWCSESFKKTSTG